MKELVVQCCKCHKIRDGKIWVQNYKDFDPELVMVSHGYCPECAEKEFSSIASLVKTLKPAVNG